MDLKLSPKQPEKKVFEGEGGSYYSWSPSTIPLLSRAKLGAGRLLLRPRGFGLPHYADSSKIGFVLQGSCTVGTVTPGAEEERVRTIKQGDAILVPTGVVSWWFNGGDSDLVIVFIGETSKAYVPGEFTYFMLTGTQGVLRGFSDDFIRRSYHMNEEEANGLVKSQSGSLVIRLDKGQWIPQRHEESSTDMIFRMGNNLNIRGVSTLTAAKSPWIEKLGLSARLEKLGARAASSPAFLADSAIQVTYVAKGGGRIQIVGINGQLALDANVKTGDLFIVPKFFTVAKIAGEEGMECFSVVTSSEPEFWELNGKASVWKAFSPEVLRISLGVREEFAQLLGSKITK